MSYAGTAKTALIHPRETYHLLIAWMVPIAEDVHLPLGKLATQSLKGRNRRVVGISIGMADDPWDLNHRLCGVGFGTQECRDKKPARNAEIRGNGNQTIVEPLQGHVGKHRLSYAIIKNSTKTGKVER